MKATLSALAAALLVASPLVSHAQTTAPAPAVLHDSAAMYAVFVDQPTGYTFVKLPTGWKFAGAVSKQQAQHLPSTVLTTVPEVDTVSAK
ncbi:hypothetical protein [Paraburkholderia solisilvae]|uniref:Uncharacterized protein n=1 Tax=Paraburkholderia solisilvae TaxID=624376 RepID=A0A6J5CZD9_9BURK|nr:hypothetical protein [Paraburkholderia solisilvae]CAB3746175.1 hypothetical protein LMG29739_00119 [Paraburkholderia solisilvae]